MSAGQTGCPAVDARLAARLPEGARLLVRFPLAVVLAPERDGSIVASDDRDGPAADRLASSAAGPSSGLADAYEGVARVVEVPLSS